MALRIRLDQDTYLRPPSMTDAAEIFAVIERNRARLRLWLPWPDAVRSVSDERRWIESSLLPGADLTSFPLMIVRHRAIIGGIGIERLGSPNRAGEVGYWLDQVFEGKGIMTSAVRAVLDYAFIQRNMNRIQIRADVRNDRSRGIPERLGFAFEGIQRQAEIIAGEFVDLAVYSMLAHEWTEKRSVGK